MFLIPFSESSFNELSFGIKIIPQSLLLRQIQVFKINHLYSVTQQMKLINNLIYKNLIQPFYIYQKFYSGIFLNRYLTLKHKKLFYY